MMTHIVSRPQTVKSTNTCFDIIFILLHPFLSESTFRSPLCVPPTSEYFSIPSMPMRGAFTSHRIIPSRRIQVYNNRVASRVSAHPMSRPSFPATVIACAHKCAEGASSDLSSNLLLHPTNLFTCKDLCRRHPRCTDAGHAVFIEKVRLSVSPLP